MRTASKDFAKVLDLVYDLVELDYEQGEQLRKEHGYTDSEVAENVRIHVDNMIHLLQTEWRRKEMRGAQTKEDFFKRDWEVQ